MPTRHRAPSALTVLRLVTVAVLLLIPWPDAQGPTFARSIWLTTGELSRTLGATFRQFDRFQSNLNTAGAGEDILPVQVQEALAIVRGRGRVGKRYQLSPGLREDAWVSQQMVASLWPRRLEPNAVAHFILSSEAVGPTCTVVDRRREVALVYCP